jgi:DNA-binding cell septation regulator SpoVG
MICIVPNKGAEVLHKREVNRSSMGTTTEGRIKANDNLKHNAEAMNGNKVFGSIVLVQGTGRSIFRSLPNRNGYSGSKKDVIHDSAVKVHLQLKL